MIIEMVTFHAGTCTKSRVITYSLDSSNWIHGAMDAEDRVKYRSNHRAGCTLCGHMHKEYSDNLHTGFIKSDASSNACERYNRLPQ